MPPCPLPVPAVPADADWSKELFRHHHACIETIDSMQPGLPPPPPPGGLGLPAAGSQPSSKLGTPFRVSGSGGMGGAEEASTYSGPMAMLGQGANGGAAGSAGDVASGRMLKFARDVKHHDGT